MKFGGHETFPIREGWLHKGLRLLTQEPEKLVADDSADWLGVGRNMAKSIRHWLVATHLAIPTARRSSSKLPGIEPSELGNIVWENDPFFLDHGTWWALHNNLVTSPDHARVWGWLFNQFGGSRFERAVSFEAAQRFFNQQERRPPSQNTLQRDVACLLQSYARNVPEEVLDPEEVRHCPFIELGLMSHYRGSGVYELHRDLKGVPPELLAYSVAKTRWLGQEGAHIDIELYDLWKIPNGPAKVFVLSHESLFELAIRCEAELPPEDLNIVGMAGQRVLRVANRKPEDWLYRYYERTTENQDSMAV